MVFMQPLCILRLPLLCRAVVRGARGVTAPTVVDIHWVKPTGRCLCVGVGVDFGLGGGGGTEFYTAKMC